MGIGFLQIDRRLFFPAPLSLRLLFAQLCSRLAASLLAEIRKKQKTRSFTRTSAASALLFVPVRSVSTFPCPRPLSPAKHWAVTFIQRFRAMFIANHSSAAFLPCPLAPPLLSALIFFGHCRSTCLSVTASISLFACVRRLQFPPALTSQDFIICFSFCLLSIVCCQVWVVTTHLASTNANSLITSALRFVACLRR